MLPFPAMLLLLVLLKQVTGRSVCETIAPSGTELRDERPKGYTLEQLRGRRWSAAVVSSSGGEETYDGYVAGQCVVGTWTREAALPPGADAGVCLAKCQQEEGCLGILYGEVEEGQKPRRLHRCFLAGVGRNHVLMEYSSPAGSGRTVVSSDALLELAATLQCWQKQRQRCEERAPELQNAKSEDSQHGMAGLLAELRTKWKSLPPLTSAARSVFRLVQPNHILLILSGFCRIVGRAADNADLAVQRCLRAAQGTVEGPKGSMAICIIIFPIFGLLGQKLRSWRLELARWQAAEAAHKVRFSDLVMQQCDDAGASSHQRLPMLLSSGMMPQTPTPQEKLPLPKPAGREHRAARSTRGGHRVITPPRPRRLRLEQLAREMDDEAQQYGREDLQMLSPRL